MGKRLIPRGIRKSTGRVPKPEATDFSGIGESSESGDFQQSTVEQQPDDDGNSGRAQSEYISPDAAANPGTDSGTSTGTRRRGRPRGSGKTGTRKTASQSTEALTGILYSLHLMGAAFLKTPELMLSEDEATQLSAAMTRVADLYDAPILTEKQLAWGHLIIAGATIYGPRFIAASVRVKEQKKERPKVVNIRPTNPEPVAGAAIIDHA